MFNGRFTLAVRGGCAGYGWAGGRGTALGADGFPTLLGHALSGGSSPRSFILLEADRCLLVAHEEGQNVAVLPIGADGVPRAPEAIIPIPGAAFPFAVA